MNYTTKSVPPKARRSSHYALALYTSVTDYGLLLGLGGGYWGVVSWAIAKGNFPGKGAAVRCDMTKSQPLGDGHSGYQMGSG